MMAPTVVLRDGVPELVLGSAGPNRIRSAILQTIVRVIDEGAAGEAGSRPPGCTSRMASCMPSPGVTSRAGSRRPTDRPGFASATCSSAGVQAVAREPDGRFGGAGDPRRGGAAVVVDGGRA